MRVKALKSGYYDNRRVKEGKEFDLLDESHFSKKWMIVVKDEVEEVASKEEVVESRPRTRKAKPEMNVI